MSKGAESTAFIGNNIPPKAPLDIKSASKTRIAPKNKLSGKSRLISDVFKINFKTFGTTIPTNAIGPTTLVIAPIQTPKTINNNLLLKPIDLFDTILSTLFKSWRFFTTCIRDKSVLKLL